MHHIRRAIDAAAIAGRPRDGVATHSALMAAGVSRDMIQRLEGFGHLRRIVRGIYLVGSATLSHRQLQQATLLRAGPGGCLTARSGLEGRRILEPRSGIVTAATMRTRAVGYHRTLLEMEGGGIGLMRLRRIDAPYGSEEEVDGLLVAPVGRALADLAAFGEPWLLERAWGQAEFRGLLDESALQRAIESGPRLGVSEVGRLLANRRILTDPETDLRGKTELPWLHRMIEAGIPMPAVNAPVHTRSRLRFADYLWSKYGVAHELDSPDHLTPAAVARDHARDAEFDEVGLHVIRFIDALALSDPEPHLTKLKSALRRRGWDGSPEG